MHSETPDICPEFLDYYYRSDRSYTNTSYTTGQTGYPTGQTGRPKIKLLLSPKTLV